MIIIVSNDRKCPDRTSRLAIFSGLSGFDRETGDGAIVLTNLNFFARLEFGDEFTEVKLGFG